MKLFYILLLCLINLGFISANVGNLVCFYNSTSHVREGPAHMSLTELEPALQFCNVLVYGYADIDPEKFELKSGNPELDINRDHYRSVTALKRKYPHLRVLLSVGGDYDLDVESTANKYLLLLEESATRQAFVNSVLRFLQTYGFDGLDLAWQFPKNQPIQPKSGIKKAWRAFKGWFTGPKIIDEKSEEHKAQFASLVRELKNAMHRGPSVLTLTMLPHVSAALFIDIAAVVPNVDFVNLGTFDFKTPIRDPKVADLPASLYEMFERNPEHNVESQVQHWLNNSAPANKLNIGVPTYGRTWIMTRDSGITGYPPIPEANGPASGGKQTVTPGLLSWPEICEKLNAHKEWTGEDGPLRKVGDPTKRYGTYAYRAADDNGAYGLWVGYEEPATAAIKADYVHAKGLGGVALFDVSMDDFRGQCANEKFPILRSIKYKL